MNFMPVRLKFVQLLKISLIAVKQNGLFCQFIKRSETATFNLI